MMISLFNSLITEIYNIKIIYRGIINRIDKNLLIQFIVKNYLFLNDEKVDVLLNQENIDDYFLKIDEFLRKFVVLKYNFNISEGKHPIWGFERLYKNYYFRKFKIAMDDIEYFTIYKILELIIKKEKEIQLEILPNVVKILHKKYNSLKTII